MERHPAETDRELMAWLEQQSGLSLVTRPERQHNQPRLMIKALSASPDLQGALQRVTEALRPAARSELARWLSVLAEEAAMRVQQETNSDLRMETFVSRLSAYPRDVAIFVIQDWTNPKHGDDSKFWPDWSTMQSRCDALSEHRRALLPALQFQEPKQVEGPPPPSDDDRASVRAICEATTAILRAHTAAVEKGGYSSAKRTHNSSRAAALAALARMPRPMDS